MKEPLASRILRYALYAAFVLGTAVVVTLPFMLDTYFKLLYDAYSLQEGYRTFLLIFLSMVGVLGLWIITELILVLRTVQRDPFIRRNVNALRRVGTAALILAVLFFLKCLYYVTFLTLVCGVAFVVCALIVYTICALFAQAVRYKEENELTI